jgi:hypothetical protein
LVVDRVGAGIPGDDLELVGCTLVLLPAPEDVVDEAVVKVEDRVETRRVVLAHIPVRLRIGRVIEVLRAPVEAADGQMHVVVRALERHHLGGRRVGSTRGAGLVMRHVLAVIPLGGRGRIGEDGVIGSVKARFEPVALPDTRMATTVRHVTQPELDVVVEDAVGVFALQRVVVGLGRVLSLTGGEARKWVANSFIALGLVVTGTRGGLGLVRVNVRVNVVFDRGLKSVRAEGVGDGPFRQGEVVLEKDGGHTIFLGLVVRLVPESHGHIAAARDSAQRLLQPEQVAAVPGGEEDVAVITIAAPPVGIAPTGAAEGLTMVASNGEERVRVRGRKLLNAMPGANQVLQWLLISPTVVVILEIANGPAYVFSHVGGRFLVLYPLGGIEGNLVLIKAKPSMNWFRRRSRRQRFSQPRQQPLHSTTQSTLLVMGHEGCSGLERGRSYIADGTISSSGQVLHWTLAWQVMGTRPCSAAG